MLLVSTDIRAAIQDEAPPTDGTNVGAVSKLGGYDAPQLLLCETRRSEEHLQVSRALVTKRRGEQSARKQGGARAAAVGGCFRVTNLRFDVLGRQLAHDVDAAHRLSLIGAVQDKWHRGGELGFESM